MADVFGRAAATYDEVIPFFTTFGERLVEIAEVSPGERVLDIASGRGASALAAARTVGPSGRVEASDVSVDMCRRLGEEIERQRLSNIEVEVIDAQTMTYEARFDVILCGFAIHLVEDLDALLARCMAALKPTGRFVASIPAGGGSDWDFFGRTLGGFASRAARPLDRPPEERDYPAAFARAGFERVEDTEETHSFMFRNAEDWWRWVWSQGMRVHLEKFDEPVLSELKDTMLSHASALMGPDGIPLDQKVRFFTARP
jgi:SAM-dependent methyltransferase